jgi:hypothetical protein
LKEVRGFWAASAFAGSAVDILNRQKFRTTPNNHGFPMTLFWFLMVALVLGGLLASHWCHASLWYQETRRGIGARKVRVPVVKHPHGRGARPALPPLAPGNDCFAPPGLNARARPGR